MGQFSNVYPPEDLVKLDAAKRKKLRDAIIKVMQADPDVLNLLREKNKLLKDKTWSEYQRLLQSKSE